MKLKIFNIDEFCEDVADITSYKLEENSKLSKTGLFSQQIFGPIKSYKCGCLKSYYRGPHSSEEVCRVCDVEITTSDIRSKRYAKISLPFEILNPVIYFILIKYKMSLKVAMDNILFYRIKYIMKSDGSIRKIKPEDLYTEEDEDFIVLEGLDGVLKLIDVLCERYPDSDEMKFIDENRDSITINNIPVIPPAFRNFSKNPNGTYSMDIINRYYSEILMRVGHIKNLPFKITKTQDIYKNYFKTVQQHIFNLAEHILNKLGSKKGLIRGNILGKRIDFSGRAVISPGPELNVDECKIPYLICLEIFKPQFTTYLVNRNVYNLYNQASYAIENCILTKDYKLFNLMVDFCEDKICMLNRQPSLHRMSILGFKIIPYKGNTIKIHPLVTSCYNADFDGDQMAIYIPVSIDTMFFKEIISKLGTWNNILSPANGTLNFTPNQDIVLGIYEITK